MSTEAVSIAGILIIIWVMFLVLGLVVSELLALITSLTFRKVFLWGLISLILPPLLILYGSLIERNLFRVKEVEIGCSNLPESFEGYRIVHLSDIHARSFQKRTKALKRAADRINGLRPDLIAFSGDLITMVPEETDGIADILAGLEASDGVVSVLGNHDYGIYSGKGNLRDGIIARERDLGWKLLLNENIRIHRGEDSIAVVGVENTSSSPHFPSKGNLSLASEGTDGMFRILLSHDPLHWEMEILGKDYPLTLSGHTHALQFSLFGWCPSRYVFPQYRGLYTEGNQHLYVNIGLGETIFPARIGALPEITLITLTRKAAE